MIAGDTPGRFMDDRQKVLAVDVGGTHLRAVVVAGTGAVLHGFNLPAEPLRDGDPVAILGEVVMRAGAAVGGGLSGVVIGVPSSLDRSRRGIVNTPNLPALKGEGLADVIEALCGLPVYLDHDATLQTRGEVYAGAAQGRNLVLGIYFGTGVGAAFLDHGALFGGNNRMQLGHVPMRGDGRPGMGGAVDSVESYASGVALQAIADQHGVKIERVFARNGSPDLAGALRRFIRDQALAVATGISLTDPEVVVIGGGVAAMPFYPFDTLVAEVAACLSPIFTSRNIVPARLGAAGASWGALQIVGQGRAART
jgi:allose kinase